MRPLLALAAAAAVYALLVAAAEEDAKKANKFRQREASDGLIGYPHLDEDALLNTKCPKHVELRWQTEVSSRIYATPLVADINSVGFQVTLLVPGNYQGDKRIVVSEIYDDLGKQGMKLPTVPVRATGTVLMEMVDKHGLYFSDEFSLTFHMHCYKLLKWLVLLPTLGMFGVLVILRPQEGALLPSFSRNID